MIVIRWWQSYIFLRKMLHLDVINQSNQPHFDDTPDRSPGDLGDMGNGSMENGSD